LTRAVELEPDAAGPRNERGVAYFRLGQWERALADFSRAVEQRPDDVVYRSNRADAYGKLGQWEKAVEDCSRVVQLQPKRELTWLQRGDAYASLGKWEKAAEDFEKAAGFPKAFQGGWSQYALVRLRLKDAKGYRQACTRMLDEWSDNEDARGTAMVAWVCSVAPGNEADLGRLSQSLEKKGVSDYVGLRALGAALYRSGKSEEAVKVLQKALEPRKAPAPAAWLFLAMANHRLGKKDDAHQWLDKAKKRIDEMGKEGAAASRPGDSPKKIVPWNELLVLELILREGEDLLKDSGK
jgi:tetratricopeptide (TPR) repeat protein